MSETNADMLRRLREEAVAEGKCKQCRLRFAKPGCKTCVECLDKHAARKERNAERGRCMCGRRRRKGRRLCTLCTQRGARGAARRRKSARINHTCLECFQRPAMTNRKRCAVCLEESRERSRRNRARRRANDIVPRRTTCSQCGATDHNAALHRRGEQPEESQMKKEHEQGMVTMLNTAAAITEETNELRAAVRKFMAVAKSHGCDDIAVASLTIAQVLSEVAPGHPIKVIAGVVIGQGATMLRKYPRDVVVDLAGKAYDQVNEMARLVEGAGGSVPGGTPDLVD